MPRSLRSLLLLLASGLLGCEQPPRTHAPRAAPTSRSDAGPRAGARTLDEAIGAYTVDDDRPWRRVLLSWTPPEKAREVARSGVLLTTTARSGAYPTPFSSLLARMERHAGVAGSIARALLVDPELNRYRYAWASAFATARGFQGRSYGTSLIRVVLRPDALVMRLDPSDTQPFRLFDRDQREVAIERFYAWRDRVAAVYHVRHAPDVPVAFREYVICNAAALASWSVATREVCGALAEERALVTRVLASVTAADAAVEASPVDQCWRGQGACRDGSVQALWSAAMATAADHYRPTPSNLRALLESLRVCDTAVVTDGAAP